MVFDLCHIIESKQSSLYNARFYEYMKKTSSFIRNDNQRDAETFIQ